MNIITLKQVIFNTIFHVLHNPYRWSKNWKDFITESVGYCKYILHIEKPTGLSLYILKVAKLRDFL